MLTAIIVVFTAASGLVVASSRWMAIARPLELRAATRGTSTVWPKRPARASGSPKPMQGVIS